MGSMDFRPFTHITFDCYGTLIDWERGILEALNALMDRHGVVAPDESILQAYARLEADIEQGSYRTYRQVLRDVVVGMGDLFGFTPEASEVDHLSRSVARWQPFPDTIAALEKLAEKYRLAIISNIDDSLLNESAKLLGVDFSAVVTAEQVRSYKPDRRNFEVALQRLEIGKEDLLHVAQSLYHDHVPAKEIGIRTVWVNRPSILPGTGATLPAEAAPDLEVPDLKTLVSLMGL
jgi:2-haloacid dehalogenase